MLALSLPCPNQMVVLVYLVSIVTKYFSIDIVVLQKVLLAVLLITPSTQFLVSLLKYNTLVETTFTFQLVSSVGKTWLLCVSG